MSTLADNFIKDGTFGRRLTAMLASFYALALLYGRAAHAGEPRAGYETVASALRAVGLHSVSGWLTGTLMPALSSSPVVPLAAATVLAVAVLSMAVTFHRSAYNISPQSASASLLALCVLIDIGAISPVEAVTGTAVTAVIVGVFCILPSDDASTGPVMVALLMFIAPMAAVLYGPAKILNWLASESPAQTVPVSLEHRTGPVRVEVVTSPDPTGARPV